MTTQLRQARCSHRLPTFHLALTGDQGVLVDSPVSRESVCAVDKPSERRLHNRASWAELGTARTRTRLAGTCPGYLPQDGTKSQRRLD